MIKKVKSCGIFLFKIIKKENGMARKIVVTSGKGGVGKTTITANLGRALAKLGLRVVLVDVDFGLNNLDVMMGVENKVMYDMRDLLDGICRVKQALVQCDEKKNLFVLPSGSIGSSTISGQSIKLVIDNISTLFDYVLIDCPAGIDVGFHRAVSTADEAIIVTTPNITSLRDADKVVSILKSYKLNKLHLVVNRARGDLMLDEKMLMPKDIQDVLKTDLIGVLPEEDAVFLSVGYSLSKKSESVKAYKMLANNLHNGGKRVYDVIRKYNGIFGSIRRSLKNSI